MSKEKEFYGSPFSIKLDEKTGCFMRIKPIKCPQCQSTKTELGDDYIYCFDCKEMFYT